MLAYEFLVAMSELALVAVPAVAHFDPVLAHLCLILGLVCLELLADAQIEIVLLCLSQLFQIAYALIRCLIGWVEGFIVEGIGVPLC